MSLLEVANIINEVRGTTKKTEKEGILRNHKDNELLRQVLNHIFNPYIKTNIAKKKLAKDVSKVKGFTPISDVGQYMEYLSNSTGNDENINTVQNYISYQPKELHWLLEAMAIKTLKIGATASTINKAFGEMFIPTFDLMLAEKYIETKKVTVKGEKVHKVFEHWQRYIGKRVIATKKLDGNRCAVFVHLDGRVELFSREGHKLEGYVDIEEAFSSFPKGFIYDGEILATNEEGLSSKDLFQKTSKIVRKKGVKQGVEFFAFDIILMDSFYNGGWEETCMYRKDLLEGIIIGQGNELVHYVEPLYVGEFDKEKIDAMAEEAKDNEEEGIMVQLADVGYECKRTFAIMKCKTFESADVRCLDVYEGKSGKNIGRLGGIVCDFKGYPVNVGIGFSDELREKLWKDPSLIVGNIVEVQYFEEFEDEDGRIDLRFAGFKTVRDDKSEESYY